MSSRPSGLFVRIGVGAIVALGLSVTLASPKAYPAGTLPPLDPAARVAVADTCPGQIGQLTKEQFDTLAATQDQLLATLGAVQTYAKPELGPSLGTRLATGDMADPSTQFGTIGMVGRGIDESSSSKQPASPPTASVTLTH